MSKELDIAQDKRKIICGLCKRESTHLFSFWHECPDGQTTSYVGCAACMLDFGDGS